MTLADDLKPVAYSARGIAGTLGFRPHSATLVFSYQNPSDGSGGVALTEHPIVEANNQPPRIKREKGENVPFGNAPGDLLKMGPITPAFSGGGFDISLFTRPLEDGESRHVVMRGPEFGDGEKYDILHVDQMRALAAFVFLQGKGEALDGYY